MIYNKVFEKLIKNDDFNNYNPLKPFARSHKINSCWIWRAYQAEHVRKDLLSDLEKVADNELTTEVFKALKDETSNHYQKVYELLKHKKFEELKKAYNPLRKIEEYEKLEAIFHILYGIDLILNCKDKVKQLKITQEVQELYLMYRLYEDPDKMLKDYKAKVSEQNRENARKKAFKPEKIIARQQIFNMARELRKNNPKLTMNAIAVRISNKLLLEGNKKNYCINGENPKTTIFSWLRDYPNEW